MGWSPESVRVRASESCDGRSSIWRRALGEPDDVLDVDADAGRSGRCAGTDAAHGRFSRSVLGLCRNLYQWPGARAQPRDLPDGARHPHGRAGRAPAGGRLVRSVVPGDPPQPRVPVFGQRVGRDPGPAGRRRQRLRDRPGQGDVDPAEPAVVGRLGPVPPGRRPTRPERAGGQLRQRQRGLPADRAGRPAPPGFVEDPAPRPGRRPRATGSSARALDQSRRGEPLRVRGRPRARRGPGLRI